jgi:hypothetical protein
MTTDPLSEYKQGLEDFLNNLIQIKTELFPMFSKLETMVSNLISEKELEELKLHKELDELEAVYGDLSDFLDTADFKIDGLNIITNLQFIIEGMFDPELNSCIGEGRICFDGD